MKKIMTIVPVVFVFFALQLSQRSPVDAGHGKGALLCEMTTGVFSGVNIEKNLFIIRRNSALVYFHAPKALCREYRGRKGGVITVIYTNEKDGRKLIRKIKDKRS